MTQSSLLPTQCVNEFTIEIDYDGINPELQVHEIDANLCATSIIGFAKFSQELLTALYGKDVTIRIVASREGSFKILTKIRSAIGVYGGIVGILAYHGYTEQEVGKLFNLYSKNIIEYIQEYHGRTHDILECIELDDLQAQEKDILKSVVANNKARAGLDDFTKPFERNGYDKITVEADNEEVFSITSDQREYFKYEQPDIVVEEEFRERVKIIYLSPELTEWKFHGTKDFWAEVQDEEFLARTKNKLPSELRGKYYIVSGIKRTVKKEGATKGSTTWEIHNAFEEQQSHTLE